MNLDHIAILDHHAHPVLREEVWQATPFESYFTEAVDPEVLRDHTSSGLFYQRSLRDLAQFYGCEPERGAVLEARRRSGYLQTAHSLIASANIDWVLLDDGFLASSTLSVAECGRVLPWQTRRILRLEVELASLVPAHDDVHSLFQAFGALLRAQAPQLAGLKSVIAYRSGLDIQDWPMGEVEREYSALKRVTPPGEVPRLASKPLLDTALMLALRVACELGLPVQFHTGYGDPDLDLRLANPLHLRALFGHPHLGGLQVVALHCYPFTREAGYLASVYPGAYLDLGLSIPFLSQHGMRNHLHEALHLAPVSKVLFSTDASRTAELFYLGALWGRRMLGQVLDETVAVGDLSAAEAERAAVSILRGTAASLYSWGAVRPA